MPIMESHLTDPFPMQVYIHSMSTVWIITITANLKDKIYISEIRNKYCGKITGMHFKRYESQGPSFFNQPMSDVTCPCG